MLEMNVKNCCWSGDLVIGTEREGKNMISNENRRVLGEINVNCDNNHAISSLTMKKIQIPKLISKKKNRPKNSDDLWNDLQGIIERNIGNVQEKTKALEIIKILKVEGNEKNTAVPSIEGKKMADPIVLEDLTKDFIPDFFDSPTVTLLEVPVIAQPEPTVESIIVETMQSAPQVEINPNSSNSTNSCIEEPNSDRKNKCDDLGLDEMPIVSERAKRRQRRASLVTTHESPNKVRRNKDVRPCTEKIVNGKSLETKMTNPLPDTTEPYVPDHDDFTDGFIHWTASPAKSSRNEHTQNDEVPLQFLSEPIFACQEQIDQITLTPVASVLETDSLQQSSQPSPKKRGRKARRKSVCAAKFQSLRGKKATTTVVEQDLEQDEQPPHEEEELEPLVSSQDSDEYFPRQSFDDCAGFLHWTGGFDPLPQCREGSISSVDTIKESSPMTPPSVAATTATPSTEEQSEETEAQCSNLSRSKRRQRRNSVLTPASDSPKKPRKLRTGTLRQRGNESTPSPNSIRDSAEESSPQTMVTSTTTGYSTPAKGQAMQELQEHEISCRDPTLLLQFIETELRQPQLPRESHLLELTSQHLEFISDLLKTQSASSPSFSAGEVILSACFASSALLSEKMKLAISTNFHHFIPLFNSFALLSVSTQDSSLSSSSSTSSQVLSSSSSTSSRKIRFGDELGGGCASPPNDRKPGSCQNFEKNSKLFGELLSAISALTELEKDSNDDFKFLMTQLRSDLHSIAQTSNGAAAGANASTSSRGGGSPIHTSILDAFSANQKMGSFLPSPQDLIKVSQLLLEEIGFRHMAVTLPDKAMELLRTSSAASASASASASVSCSSLHSSLYLPFHWQSGHLRTTLRHQSTWTTVSVIRYHLRWLLDDPPLRAEKIQLLGASPLRSSRSMVTQLTPITPIPQTQSSSKSEPIDITTSSAFTLALQQIFNGLSESFSSPLEQQQQHQPITTQSLFKNLQKAVQNFQNKIQQTLLSAQLTPKDLLHFAQVYSSPFPSFPSFLHVFLPISFFSPLSNLSLPFVGPRLPWQRKREGSSSSHSSRTK
jgi:hypothetical protein